METIKRVPRPTGATEIGTQSTLNPKQEKNIQEYYMDNYIENNFMLFGIGLSIEAFSTYTKIPIPIVMERITLKASGHENELLTREELTGTLRAMISGLFQNAWADRARAVQQFSQLAEEQGHGYVPFLTGAVNQAMKNMMDSNKAQLDIMKSLLPGNGLETLLLSGPNQGGADPNALTPTRAIELINQQPKHKPLLQDPEAIKALEHKHDLAMMPEVVARKQQGRDTRKEALNFDKLEQLQLEKVDLTEKHQDRRAKELGVDLEFDEL